MLQFDIVKVNLSATSIDSSLLFPSLFNPICFFTPLSNDPLSYLMSFANFPIYHIILSSSLFSSPFPFLLFLLFFFPLLFPLFLLLFHFISLVSFFFFFFIFPVLFFLFFTFSVLFSYFSFFLIHLTALCVASHTSADASQLLYIYSLF